MLHFVNLIVVRGQTFEGCVMPGVSFYLSLQQRDGLRIISGPNLFYFQHRETLRPLPNFLNYPSCRNSPLHAWRARHGRTGGTEGACRG